MKATVKVTNLKKGRFAAQGEAGQFFVYDLLDPEDVRVGDILCHPHIQAPGGKEIENLTRGVTMLVFVTNIVFNFDDALHLCFL